MHSHLPHKVTTGPLGGWKGEIQVGKLILGLCHGAGWVLCCPSLAYQTWFFSFRAVSLKKINVFPPPLQSCFCKCLWCHMFQSELNFFYSVLVRHNLIFHTLAGARILLVYWRHYCHFLSLSFLNLPNPELWPFVEMIFCLPALHAVCQIMCKRSQPTSPGFRHRMRKWRGVKLLISFWRSGWVFSG